MGGRSVSMMMENKGGKKGEREREKKDIDRNNIPAATLEYYNLYRAEFKSRGEHLSLDEANRIGLYRAKFPERRHGFETIPSLPKGRFSEVGRRKKGACWFRVASTDRLASITTTLSSR